MDAIRRFCGVLATLTMLTGCVMPGGGSRVRGDSPAAEPAESSEPPVIVDATAASQPALDPVEQRVMDYIARLEAAAAAVAARTRAESARHARREFVTAQDERAAPAPEQPTTATQPAAAEATPPQDAAPGGADTAQPAAPTEAPAITAVAARGIGEPATLTAPAGDQPPRVNAPAAAANPADARTLADLVDHWLSEAEREPSFRRQVDARLMRLMLGDYEQARRPLDVATDAQREMARRIVDAVIAIREGHLGDPQSANRSALESLEPLVDTLRSGSAVEISTPALCSEVRGFGQFQPIEPAEFASGEAAEFVAYVEVRNFRSEQRDDAHYHTLFDMRTTILTAAGDAVLELRDSGIVDRCRNRRHDCFIPRLVRLPATLSPGTYVLKITLVDKLADCAAESRATFRVTAPR
ncbi:MAG: hypothetical protein CHACPFDD_02698 [Phycisphaerae bacterium]|nr:hypothetical protein [Phycisphaerae bacterium]